MNTGNIELDNLLSDARRATRARDAAATIEACEQALAIAPGDTRFVFMLGVALRRAGEHEKAEPLLRQIVDAAPDLATAHQEFGLNKLGLGRLSDARQSLEKAARLDPGQTGVWRALYQVRGAEGDDFGAAEAFRRSLGSAEIDPALKKALDLFEAGRLGVAEGICREYLRQRPMDVNAIRLLAEIGIKLGIVDEAVRLLDRCLELAPDFHIARANYATALGRQQRFDDALAQLDILEKRDPDNISYQVQRASILSMAGRFEDAHEKFSRVLERVPGNARILTSYGHSLRYGGKGAEATEAYQDAIKADPDAGEAYWSLANLKTFRFPDEQIEAMQKRLDNLEKPSADKYHLAFALGKALEDAGQYDESFEAYAIGNRIKREFSAYDHEETTARVDAMIEHCGENLFDDGGHPSDEPIFIVGLPRAGSTLLEQILASHSDVEATAELPFIGEIAGELSGKRKRRDQSEYPAVLNELSRNQREALGQQYLARAAVYRSGSPRFIDKLPNNWLHVGLIKTILPNATIIDARREPMAAGFANFKQLFARGQEFTYSLEDVGHYYADYLRLMAHWQDVLPGEVLTVRYESVVDDLETQVAALLEHCSLPFEEACVRYYEKDRAVRTASSEQVRQPIYRDALTLWQRYEAHLEPLSRILAERGVTRDPNSLPGG